jgi:hypothetical protein
LGLVPSEAFSIKAAKEELEDPEEFLSYEDLELRSQLERDLMGLFFLQLSKNVLIARSTFSTDA